MPVAVLSSHDVALDGPIVGVGSAAGRRAVVGCRPCSSFGAFTDVMVERSDGHCVLFAPSRAVADFVAQIYSFDET